MSELERCEKRTFKRICSAVAEVAVFVECAEGGMLGAQRAREGKLTSVMLPEPVAHPGLGPPRNFRNAQQPASAVPMLPPRNSGPGCRSDSPAAAAASGAAAAAPVPVGPAAASSQGATASPASKGSAPSTGAAGNRSQQQEQTQTQTQQLQPQQGSAQRGGSPATNLSRQASGAAAGPPGARPQPAAKKAIYQPPAAMRSRVRRGCTLCFAAFHLFQVVFKRQGAALNSSSGRPLMLVIWVCRLRWIRGLWQ